MIFNNPPHIQLFFFNIFTGTSSRTEASRDESSRAGGRSTPPWPWPTWPRGRAAQQTRAAWPCPALAPGRAAPENPSRLRGPLSWTGCVSQEDPPLPWGRAAPQGPLSPAASSKSPLISLKSRLLTWPWQTACRHLVWASGARLVSARRSIWEYQMLKCLAIYVQPLLFCNADKLWHFQSFLHCKMEKLT